MLGIGAWDWAALLIYLIGITAVGVWMARKVKDTSDFFMGGRRFGKPFMIFFAFGAGTSGNDAVGVSAKTYTNGISGIWYQWLWLFATPFYWLIAPVFRRMRALTTGDYFEQRYDQSVAALYSIVGITFLTVNIGILLLGAGLTIEALSDGGIKANYAIFTMTVLFVTYGIAGGLAAAIVTDFVQGILTVILSFMILPFAWNAVGGMEGLREGIPGAMEGQPQIRIDNMLSMVSPGEINLFHIVMFALSALIGIVTQPHIMGVCAGGRNEMDGRVGFAGGNLLKRVCTVAWMLTGLCAVVYFAQQGNESYQSRVAENPNLVYGLMARDLFPTIAPGLIGIFLAALLASIMSSCDAFMVSCSGLFTENVYRRYWGKGKPESHFVFVGRITAFVIVCFALVFAFSFDDIPRALEVFFQLQAMMGAAFWLGLFWRRTTVAGAWAGTLAAFGIWWLTGRPQFHEFAVENLPAMMIWDDKFRVSWQTFAFLSGGFLSCILVSLVTPRVAEKKLDQLYACLRTPIQPNEPHLAPFTLPPGVEPPAPRKLINHPDLEIPMPSLVGIGGFLVIWLLVAIMVGFVFFIVGLGQ